MAKISVILFNLGGPDKPSSVKPFLYNLFSDPAIIRLPTIFRKLVAWMISTLRAPKAKKIYEHLGGASPIVPNTMAQAEALTKLLKENSEHKFQVSVAMRYWHPFTEEAVKATKAFGADQVILLPLYPQFSTTTTASSVKEWHRVAKKNGLNCKTKVVCCYPQHPLFARSYADLAMPMVSNALSKHSKVRVLFSAHGLPQKVVEQGDPYQWQVEQSVAKIWEVMGVSDPKVSHVICYQSRVGPMKWIGPSTEDEIKRAGEQDTAVVLVPVAFVSEHSETLVELDHEYKLLAEEHNVPGYYRVSTLGVNDIFIAALKELCLEAVGGKGRVVPAKPICPSEYGECYCRSVKLS